MVKRAPASNVLLRLSLTRIRLPESVCYRYQCQLPAGYPPRAERRITFLCKRLGEPELRVLLRQPRLAVPFVTCQWDVSDRIRLVPRFPAPLYKYARR